MNRNSLREPVVVFGAGGHSSVVIDILKASGIYQVAAVLNEETEFRLAELGISKGVVAIGDNWLRSQVVKKITQANPQFEFITALHPAACLSPSVELGAGTVVMPGVVINAHATIGKHNIVNTQASIDHNCLLGDYVTIAPGAILGGSVTVGTLSAVCLGAKILHNIHIGEGVVIGAGSLVTRNVASHQLAYGVPCRVIRTRQNTDPYLTPSRREGVIHRNDPVRRKT